MRFTSASAGEERDVPGLRRDRHRSGRHRRLHRIRAGQARVPHAQRRQAPRRRVRLDLEHLRDHPSPLLDARRRGDGARVLLLLARLGEVRRRAGPLRAGPLRQHRLPRHEDGEEPLPAAGEGESRRTPRRVRGPGRGGDAREALRPRHAAVRPSRDGGGPGVRPADGRERVRGRLHPGIRLHQRPATLLPQRSTRVRGARRRVPLQHRGDGDPAGEREGRGRPPEGRVRGPGAGRGERGRAPLLRHQPDGGGRGRDEHQDARPEAGSLSRPGAGGRRL